jgi:hypothetical protein
VKGVVLLLPSGSKVPGNISQSRGVVVQRTDKPFVRLVIPGGTAAFSGDETVTVSLNHGTRETAIIQGEDVLEIKSTNGKLLERNRLLCLKCFTNSGQISRDKPPKRGIILVTCHKCNHTWAYTTKRKHRKK